MALDVRRQRGIFAIVSIALAISLSGCSQDASQPPVVDPTAQSPAASKPSTSKPTPTPTESHSPTPTPSESHSPTIQLPAKVTQKRPGWALDRIDQRLRPLDQKFTTVGQGKGVTVYVVDGLFDVKNADFGGRASAGLAAGLPCILEDGTNHALFVAGLVAGSRTGVAKQAKIVSVGSSYGCEGADGATDAQLTARLVKAIDWVVQHASKPAVVNLSLNVPAPAPAIIGAVKRLIGAGLTVVVSAGNDGEDACQHPPAGVPGVVTAAAMTQSDADAGLNYGKCVDLFAPAENLTSVADATLSPDRLVTSDFAATSWAAPVVSGAAALYLSVHKTATPAEVRTWLIDNATKGAVKGPLHGSPNRLLFTGGPL
jgi:subtilisin family serine protease